MIDATTLLTIVLMASATYLTRALGYTVLRGRVLSRRATAMMEAAPACVLISVIAPAFATRNPADLLALAITLLAATRLPMLATVLIGIAAAGLLRHVMGVIYFITHPDVVIDPAVPVCDWKLSPRGRERMACALALPWVDGLRALWCSTERKARDGAAILAAQCRLPVTELATLGENDRSATGYLPRAEFEAVADQFFARPNESIRGWERAVDAQRRIVAALAVVAAEGGDSAVVAHGGVGALLLSHLRDAPIGRQYDQPANNGGNYFAFDGATFRLLHGWRPIDG